MILIILQVHKEFDDNRSLLKKYTLYHKMKSDRFWDEFKLSGKMLISLYLEFMIKSALSMILELMKFRKTIGTVSKKKCLSRKLRNTVYINFSLSI